MSDQPIVLNAADEKPTNTSCEVKIKFTPTINGIKQKAEYRWILKRVSDLQGRPAEIRCPYCQGPIRLHFKGAGKKWVDDHFEHLGERAGTSDRTTCVVGEGFKGGEYKRSTKPVE